MVIFDSDVWIALLNKNDSQHQKAKLVFESIKENIILPEYVFIEISSVLSLKVGKGVADDFIKIALNNKNIRMLVSRKEYFAEIVDIFIKSPNKHLSFIDFSLLYFSKKFKVITFDKKLKKAIET